MAQRRQFGHFRNRVYLKGRFPIADQQDPVRELEFFRGDTIRLEVQVFDECDNVVDLTDHDITVTVKCEDWSEDILFQATLADDPSVVEVINILEGVIQITFPTEFTEILEPRAYVFDIQLVRESDGFVSTVIRDYFSIKRDITLPPSS